MFLLNNLTLLNYKFTPFFPSTTHASPYLTHKKPNY